MPGSGPQPCPLVFSNPTPGVVINRPNGSDVYAGVLKDYTGEVRPRRGFFSSLGWFSMFWAFLAPDPH